MVSNVFMEEQTFFVGEELANQNTTLDRKVSRQFMWLVGIQVAILLAVVGALLSGG